MNRYTLYENSGDIIATGNNKAELIKKCRSLKNRATVEDEIIGGIIFENKAQRAFNYDMDGIKEAL